MVSLLDSKPSQFLLTALHPLAWVNIYEMLLYDLFLRVDTFGSVATGDIPADRENRDQAVAYMPAFRSALRWGLDRVLAREKGFSHLAFVDCGSGKGKMCFLAESRARHAGSAWRQMTGVELNPRLADIARRNGRRLGSRADFLAADILDYQGWRPGTVVFAFNPFGPRVMEALEERLRAIPGLYFIYNNPLHAGIFREWTPVARRRSLIASLRTEVFLSPGR